MHPFIYKRYRDHPTKSGRPYRAVKVAIVDTGIARAENRPRTVELFQDRIKESNCMAFGGLQRGDIDTDGHGTHVALCVLQVCPNAELYIARVTEDGQNIDRKAVAAAVKWAIGKRVDIINFSLGWYDQEYDDKSGLKAALTNATSPDDTGRSILVFAATSNDRNREELEIAYPAVADSVFGIDAASGGGKPELDMNPVSSDANNRRSRFTAPGRSVLSASPKNLTGPGEQLGEKRADGTSFATPLAAGIAALVLEFSRQPPLSKWPQIQRVLKQKDAMEDVLFHLISEQEIGSPFRFLRPSKLFNAAWLEDGSYDGGDADDELSRRSSAASAVRTCLRKRYGDALFVQ